MMTRQAIKAVLAAGVLGSAVFAQAAGGGGAQQMTQRAYVYRCSGKETVKVQYVMPGGEGSALPTFAVLTYRGQSYGLAPAVSGSGSRYLGHVGLNLSSGLEWWEHQGEGTLSTFRGDDASQTKPLLSCRLSAGRH